MTIPLEMETSEAHRLRTHYEGVALDTLQVLWRRKLLITVMVIAALLLGCGALVLMPPRYTSEAIIQLNFIREESTTGTRIQPVAAVDAVSLVDSAARVIRSRATASAVVSRLGLDKDPEFARESRLQRALSRAQDAIGLQVETPSPRDLAVNQLMQRVNITNAPRSYLISIAITTGNPEQSAELANAVALEYLRSQMLQQINDAQAVVEREMAQLSSVYGERHPSYVLGRNKLEALRARLSVLRDNSFTEEAVKLMLGPSLVMAEKVMLPSGPNILAILGLALGGGLAAGIGLAILFPPRRRRVQPDQSEKRTVEPTRAISAVPDKRRGNVASPSVGPSHRSSPGKGNGQPAGSLR
jgi:uncharacterized protein involved in exopolysaccharide biosynthesis